MLEIFQNQMNPAAIDFWAKNFSEKLNQLRTQEPATFLYY